MAIAVAFCTETLQAAPPTIEFELVTERGFPLGGAQQWVELLSRLGETSIRIRQAESGDRETVENRGTEAQPHYRVVGVLTAGQRLLVPGGNFGPRDRTRLADWIKKLREEGVAAPTAKAGAFGLSDEQLVAFHDKLAVHIRCDTRGRRAGDVARDIVRDAAVEFSVSDEARAALRSSAVVRDDLQQLSTGTALAAVVRPLGLVIRPEKVSGGKTRLLICGASETRESWPVGWPLQEIPVKVAPTLFETLKVTITSQPLAEVMAAVQPRTKVPFVVDYAALAKQRIDVAEARVSYSKEVDTYQRILSKLFFQAKLTSELRVDEDSQPLVWVSPR